MAIFSFRHLPSFAKSAWLDGQRLASTLAEFWLVRFHFSLRDAYIELRCFLQGTSPRPPFFFIFAHISSRTDKNENAARPGPFIIIARLSQNIHILRASLISAGAKRFSRSIITPIRRADLRYRASRQIASMAKLRCCLWWIWYEILFTSHFMPCAGMM